MMHEDGDDSDIYTDEEGDEEPQADSEEGQDQLEGQYMHFFYIAITQANWDWWSQRATITMAGEYKSVWAS